MPVFLDDRFLRGVLHLYSPQMSFFLAFALAIGRCINSAFVHACSHVFVHDLPTMSWSLTQVYINSPHRSKDKKFLFCTLFIHVSFNLMGIFLNICRGVKVVSSAPFCPYRRIYARPSLLGVRQVRLHEFEGPHQRLQ